MRGLLTLAFLLLAAAPARADTLVATVARPTTVDAAAGRAVWSAWDGSAYRLTEYADGQVQTDPRLAGSRIAFTRTYRSGARVL